MRHQEFDHSLHISLISIAAIKGFDSLDVDQQMPDLLNREIYVFGMGYVGLTLAVALADAD